MEKVEIKEASVINKNKDHITVIVNLDNHPDPKTIVLGAFSEQNELGIKLTIPILNVCFLGKNIDEAQNLLNQYMDIEIEKYL